MQSIRKFCDKQATMWMQFSKVFCLRLSRYQINEFKHNTYCLYFSSDDFSRNGIPDKNKIINVVNSGDKMPIHSIPLMTLIDITKMPHQMRISPK